MSIARRESNPELCVRVMMYGCRYVCTPVVGLCDPATFVSEDTRTERNPEKKGGGWDRHP